MKLLSENITTDKKNATIELETQAGKIRLELGNDLSHPWVKRLLLEGAKALAWRGGDTQAAMEGKLNGEGRGGSSLDRQALLAHLETIEGALESIQSGKAKCVKVGEQLWKLSSKVKDLKEASEKASKVNVTALL